MLVVAMAVRMVRDLEYYWRIQEAVSVIENSLDVVSRPGVAAVESTLPVVVVAAVPIAQCVVDAVPT